MNTEYFKSIHNINLELLPKVIREEYEKVRFGYDINRLGIYRARAVYQNVYADTTPITDEKKLVLLSVFNNNVSEAWQSYEDGFLEGSYEEDMFIGIPNPDDQIYEVFSRIYKKHANLQNPGILQFKKYPAPSKYGNLFFLQKHFYKYGFEVGQFIRAWSIILNNPNLFEAIFTKHLGSEEINENQNPFPEIFIGADNRAYNLFRNYIDIISEPYSDFSFIFQKMKKSPEVLIHERISHEAFRNWLLDQKLISIRTHQEFIVKSSFTTKADSVQRLARYYKLKERHFPDTSD